jgi:type II secretory pathway pseudopilin PulG
MRDAQHMRAGFTILELAIVVTMIGIIMGAIVFGRNVINNTQLENIISDVNRFKNAAKLFRDKYTYLPGDLPTATTFWGADAGCPTGNTASPYESRIVTCNGDGNGKIRNVTNSYTTPSVLGDNNYESLRAWQHLANAGFIEGAYSGVGYGGMYKPGVNIPQSKANNLAGFIFFYSDPIDANNRDPGGNVIAEVFPGDYGHVIEYGGVAGIPSRSLPTSQAFSQSFGLTAVEAHSVDSKIDDGAPGTGSVLSFTTDASGNPNCNDSSSPPQYKSTDTTAVCSLIFITGL